MTSGKETDSGYAGLSKTLAMQHQSSLAACKEAKKQYII
jgi:hypothetical protein